MIYLIITTSIHNKFGIQDGRKERYLYSISETLKILPPEIKPIIVENNAMDHSYLDTLQVDVLYTSNNNRTYKSKGVNEMLDIKEVITTYGIKDDDIIIKLTGRYRALSSRFFEEVMKNDHDAFIKFYGTCSLTFDKYDCILGCYAIRCKFIKLYNHLSIDNYQSAEVAFARYVRLCGARFKEVEQLDIECSFSDDSRILIV